MSSESDTAERGNRVIPVVSETAGSSQGSFGEGSTQSHEPDPGQAMRASVYEMLAALLSQTPDPALVERLASLDVIDTSEGAIAMGWELLRQASLKVTDNSAGGNGHEALTEEYFNLFIGVGRGELVPFGSWYLTGFLMEKPLSLLRTDLAELNIQRQEGIAESEDHIASLCDAMALIIRSGDDVSFDRQKAFFKDHMEPWAARFFSDLQNASGAGFYRSVGFFGESYMDFEQQYFDMQS